MVTVGKKVCQYDAQIEHELILEECGLRLVIPREVIIPVESVYKVDAQGLWGVDKFEFSEGSTLVSAVCYISVSSSFEFNKRVTVELMHSANITDERQTQYLSFVTLNLVHPLSLTTYQEDHSPLNLNMALYLLNSSHY